VNLRPFIARLLSIVTILSFVAAPSAAAMMDVESMAAMESMASIADDMPCPQQKQSLPDCQKMCPLVTLCVAKCFPNVAAASISLRSFFMIASVLAPWDDTEPDLLLEPPPPGPPRT
jgi:hypothetical protein